MVPGRAKEHGRLDVHGIAFGESAATLRAAPLCRTRSVNQSGHGQLRGAHTRAGVSGAGGFDDRLRSADILSALSAKREQIGVVETVQRFLTTSAMIAEKTVPNKANPIEIPRNAFDMLVSPSCCINCGPTIVSRTAK